jgi:hypothetical protein
MRGIKSRYSGLEANRTLVVKGQRIEGSARWKAEAETTAVFWLCDASTRVRSLGTALSHGLAARGGHHLSYLVTSQISALGSNWDGSRKSSFWGLLSFPLANRPRSCVLRVQPTSRATRTVIDGYAGSVTP